MNTLTLTMALLMGFTGSLHCAGMCGPIMWAIQFQQFKGFKRVAAIGLYHLGRITSYAVLAVILHSFRNLFEPRLQQYVSVALGILLLFAGVVSFVPGRFSSNKLPWASRIQKLLGKLVGSPTLRTLTLSGVLNGLLPCGLVYMALSASLSATTVLQSVSFMYFFGMGTLPMLLAITLLKARLSFLRANNVRKLVPVIILSFGCLFILRGMNLGIPYLSPKVVMEQHAIKSCCCHKK